MGEGQTLPLAQWALVTQGLQLSDPFSGSLGTPEIVPTQSASGKEYAVSGWCHANLAGGQSPELTGRSIALEPGDQL